MTTTTAKPTKELVATANGGRQNDAVRDLVAHAARIQLASLTAASKFLAGWAQAADRYAQAVSDELLGRIRGETASANCSAGSRQQATDTCARSRLFPTALSTISTRSSPRRPAKARAKRRERARLRCGRPAGFIRACAG